jgi:beta-lactamase class A
MRRTPGLAIAFLFLTAAGFAADQSTVLSEITRLEREYGGHLGLMARNLDTGETVSYNASERFPTASVIKLPVMAAFFGMVDTHRLDPGTRIALTRDDKKPGSGILQLLSDGTSISLLDAVKLMIVLSDNTATNLVLDRLAPTHAERLNLVNSFLVQKGLKNTRILNRLYSPETKASTPEAIRYGIGVSTPEDMVLLLEALFRKALAESSSCDSMIDILRQQMYRETIPRLLPEEECKFLQIGNKTGSVNESKVDVALIQSDKANLAIAVFVDKHPDHREDVENRGMLLGAHVARALWNHFTGSRGYESKRILPNQVDWNRFPGGRWAIYRSAAAPFPHKERMSGFRGADGTQYPYQPHYSDDSVVVVIPDGFRETADGTNLIIHFHGHGNDNMGVLEQYGMPGTLVSRKINALLVLPQGPYRAKDSFGGKMEDPGGLRKLVDDVLQVMKQEEVVKGTRVNKLLISAHSGGYRPAAFAVDRGGLEDRVSDLFLFDAFYGQQDLFLKWLTRGRGTLRAAYTAHLAGEHKAFEQGLDPGLRARVRITPTSVEHDKVIQEFFDSWLGQLGQEWRQP